MCWYFVTCLIFCQALKGHGKILATEQSGCSYTFKHQITDFLFDHFYFTLTFFSLVCKTHPTILYVSCIVSKAQGANKRQKQYKWKHKSVPCDHQKNLSYLKFISLRVKPKNDKRNQSLTHLVRPFCIFTLLYSPIPWWYCGTFSWPSLVKWHRCGIKSKQ